MKKIGIILLCLTAMICCSSCELLLAILGGISEGYTQEQFDFETVTYENLTKTNDHYYVECNTSETRALAAYNTAYCQYGYTSSSRNADDNIVENSSDLEILASGLQNTSLETEIYLNETYNKLMDDSRYAVTYYDAPANGYFYVFDTSSERSMSLVKCTQYTGKTFTNCRVWYYNNSKLVEDTELKEMCYAVGTKFDSICALEEKIMGSNEYATSEIHSKYYDSYNGEYTLISSKSKIDIVVYDIYGDSSESQNGGVFGYFNKNDFSRISSYSNQTQAIFIDSYFYKKSPDMIYSTLVHEYNHLLNFVNKEVKNYASLETWYTEMLSMIVEDAFQSYLGIEDLSSPKGRLYSGLIARNTNNKIVLNFNNTSSSAFLTNYNLGITNWNNSNPYANYSNAYAFGAYLVRNFGGFDLLKEIASNKYSNIESIDKALESMSNPYFTTESGTKIKWTFDSLLAREYQILLNNNTDSSTLSLNKGEYYSGNSAIKFSPIDIYKIYYLDGSDNKIHSYSSTSEVKQAIVNWVYHSSAKDSRRYIGQNGFDVSYIPEGYVGLELEVPDISDYSCNLYPNNF